MSAADGAAPRVDVGDEAPRVRLLSRGERIALGIDDCPPPWASAQPQRVFSVRALNAARAGSAEACQSYGCLGVAGPVRAASHPALVPFCSGCRQRGRSAIHRGYTTPDAVGEWVARGLRRASRARAA